MVDKKKLKGRPAVPPMQQEDHPAHNMPPTHNAQIDSSTPNDPSVLSNYGLGF
jgi:hypothetical protein